MTTLVIHPQLIIQKRVAFEYASKILGNKLNIENLPPDIHLLDGTMAKSLGIDEVRELLRQLQYQPYSAPFQLGIILMANLLTPEAQSSLLKTLEEPNPQTQFILTVPHEKFLLPTIISRSHKIYVPEVLNVKEGKDQFSDIERFLELPIVEQFLKLEDILEQEKEQGGALNEFLSTLIKEYRLKLLTETMAKSATMKQAADDVRKISRALHFISRNANKRLTLENLILQLNHSKNEGEV